jgi:hypothetical protein
VAILDVRLTADNRPREARRPGQQVGRAISRSSKPCEGEENEANTSHADFDWAAAAASPVVRRRPTAKLGRQAETPEGPRIIGGLQRGHPIRAGVSIQPASAARPDPVSSPTRSPRLSPTSLGRRSDRHARAARASSRSAPRSGPGRAGRFLLQRLLELVAMPAAAPEYVSPGISRPIHKAAHTSPVQTRR